MKFEKINERKSKITYTLKELENKNIDPGKLASDSEEAQDFLLDIVEGLRDRFDFDISSSKLMIEASSTPGKELVVTVTSLEEEEKDSLPARKFPKIRPQKENSDTNVVIRFESMDNAVAFARSVAGKLEAKSELYKLKSEYFLNIMPKVGKYLDKASLMRLCSDFGSYMQNAGIYEGYLREHALLLVPKQALKKLSEEF